VAAARWLRRWRQRDIVTSAAAWRLRGGGGSGNLVWGVDQRVVAMAEVGERERHVAASFDEGFVFVC